jgi:hypothetical protein
MAAKNDQAHYATRDFNDAGTAKRFARGAKIDAEPGEIANYVAAGLAATEKSKADASEPATPPA